MSNIYLVEWNNGLEYDDCEISTICVYKNVKDAEKVCKIFKQKLQDIIKTIQDYSFDIPRPTYNYKDSSKHTEYYKELVNVEKKIQNFVLKLLKKNNLPCELVLTGTRFWHYPKCSLSYYKINYY